MFVEFWGVRGSYPVPGPATNRFGGNTACVQIGTAGGTTVILDAGTGLRRLGQRLGAGAFGEGRGRCHLLISHTHWDHIQGLPFFAPLYVAGNEITIYGRQREVHLRTLFNSQSDSPYFPVSLDQASAAVSCQELMEGASFQIEEVKVRCARLNHPYIAIGYRLEADGATVAYVADTAPFDRIVLGYEFIPARPDLDTRPASSEEADELAAMREGVVDLCRDADLVIYDTMFEMSEYLACPHWGHSTPEHALPIVEQAGARCLALFHHAPQRSDDDQAAIVAATQRRTQVRVIGAREGLRLQLGRHGIEGAD